MATHRAVLMPAESLAWAEDEDGHMCSAHLTERPDRPNHDINREGVSKHEAPLLVERKVFHISVPIAPPAASSMSLFGMCFFVPWC